jgi:hypothetical protein
MSFLLRPQVALFIAALVVPALASGACSSRTACLAYTQPEYAANNNSCLSQADALATFTSPDCPGSIASVDGPGTFDGEICCYPVTYDPVVQSCNVTNTGPTPPGTTFPGTSFPTTTGVTTSFCPPTCSQALISGSIPCAGEPAIQDYLDLLGCAGCMDSPVDGGVTCADDCPVLCSEGPLDPVCASCLMNECGSSLSTCQSN